MFTPTAQERYAAAEAIGVHEQYLYQWLTGRREVPKERCHEIEQAFAGRVTCEELRGDLVWVRVPDSAWPWHLMGRPALDVSRSKVTKAPLDAANTPKEQRHAA